MKTMKLFDVHTHIQDRRVHHDRKAMIQRALDAGVSKIMVCGLHEGDWDQVLAMADEHDCLVPSLGIHPWFIDHRTGSWDQVLRDKIKNSRAAVGEIGLDRMIPKSNDKDQEAVFITQLEIAKEFERPVNIHCRKAWGRMVEILKEMGGLPHGGIVHSWSGSVEMLRECEKLGASISFSGSATRPDNKKVRKAVLAVSPDRLVVETDSPDILPSGVDADLNEPAFVRHVMTHVARLRNDDVLELADRVYRNSLRVFACCQNVEDRP